MKPCPLTIELVPSTCWYSNVRSNVHAATWDRLQAIHFRQAGHRCEVCNGVGSTHPVELHEIWHYDDDQCIQRLDGLITLCPRCHQVKHMGRMLPTSHFPAVLTHFARANNLSPSAAYEAVRQALLRHRSRSQHPWSLDIGWLRRHHGIVLDASQREAKATR